MTTEEELQQIIDEEQHKHGLALANSIERMLAASEIDPHERGVLVEHLDFYHHRVTLSYFVPQGEVSFVHL